MKIAFFEVEDWQKNYFKESSKMVELSFFAEPLSLENIDSASECQNYFTVYIFCKSTKIFWKNYRI